MRSFRTPESIFNISALIALLVLFTSAEAAFTFSGTLRRGLSSEEVRILQQTLAGDKDIYPEGLVSGYFGPLTEAAVKRFQAKYDIINYGDPESTGFGLVGPRTRAKLNETLNNTAESQPSAAPQPSAVSQPSPASQPNAAPPPRPSIALKSDIVPLPGVVDVIITEDKFVPQVVVIKKGERIRWVNTSSFPEEPVSMPHEYSLPPQEQEYRLPDYPELDPPGGEGDRDENAIPPGGSRTTPPLTRVGWWGYHNHAAGPMWHGLVIVQEPSTGEPTLSSLRSKLPATALKKGMSGPEVKALQEFLRYNSVIYPEGEVTGYFGPLTERAVRRFQLRYDFIDLFVKDQSAVELIGPKTIDKLHEVFGLK